ncbi:SDR family NAD(P)-dependent oxidoreductase [Streptomyces sp. NPDC023723]|uniref:SDR family NAD(P)-dependent oxidoreductase n=1 Tax=Streptomyces sp. NPDC023723 TaxID=3154323 RepID=UPI003401D852
MKTVVITGGTDGIGRGLARVHLERGDQVVVVGTDKAKAEPGAWFIRADLERRETADGLESNFALTYLSRFLLSHGLAGLLGRAADPVVLNFGGAGRFGPPRWDDLQQRTRYHGLTAMIQAGILNAALAVDFVGRHPAIRYVNTFPGTVATSFAGDYDEAEAAQICRLRATGKREVLAR